MCIRNRSPPARFCARQQFGIRSEREQFMFYRSFFIKQETMTTTKMPLQGNPQRQPFHSERDMIVRRKRRRDDIRVGRVGCSTRFSAFGNGNVNVILLATIVIVLWLSEPTFAGAWLSSKRQYSPGVTRAWRRNPLYDPMARDQRLYGTPRRSEPNNDENRKNNSQLQFQDDDSSSGSSDDLDSLRAQAAKLRQEAASLQSALQESQEQKIQRQLDKVDGWIDDLLIEVSMGDGTELLKTVDQVYDALKDKRYSARHVLQIFDRLCDMREQESRSNCSPLMELLVDATGKLDCLEREENPNKRWNHRVERVLRRKLFARDWNIDYVSEDEEFW